MLTVHGRMREQKGQNTGIANWDKIRHVCEALTIPVVANGNLQARILFVLWFTLLSMMSTSLHGAFASFLQPHISCV